LGGHDINLLWLQPPQNGGRAPARGREAGRGQARTGATGGDAIKLAEEIALVIESAAHFLKERMDDNDNKKHTPAA
jgi:hypothetical protein